MKIQFRWLVALLILNLGLTPDARSQKPYDIGRMGGSSMTGKFPFEGAFFSTESVADRAMPSHSTNRIVKFAFRSKLGWYAIAYYPENQRKVPMKEYGRFTVVSADKGRNSYVITLYDPDYKGEYKAVVPNPSQPNDLSGKKQVATIELKVDGSELAATVKNANSNHISFASGDTFRMTAGPRSENSQQKEKDGLPPSPEGKTWKLVWHDEFDGLKLDTTKWDIPEYKRRDGYWSRKAISLDGKGHLVMSVLKDGDKFLDGCVRTRGKFEHSFGYYVTRVQLQKQPGHWTAFWIMGTGMRDSQTDGRAATEIDIYEKPWLDDRVQQTLHWGGYGRNHKSAGNVAKVSGVMEGWHTFGLWWKPNEYIFYVDGKETWRTKAGGVCQVPEYIKLSDEIGNWAGDIKKAKLPDAFLVDYVRVYDVVEAKAAIETAKVPIALLTTALDTYQLDVSAYPTTAQGLHALRTPPLALTDPTKWAGPYLEKDVPLDPWGKPYR